MDEVQRTNRLTILTRILNAAFKRDPIGVGAFRTLVNIMIGGF